MKKKGRSSQVPAITLQNHESQLPSPRPILARKVQPSQPHSIPPALRIDATQNEKPPIGGHKKYQTARHTQEPQESTFALQTKRGVKRKAETSSQSTKRPKTEPASTSSEALVPSAASAPNDIPGHPGYTIDKNNKVRYRGKFAKDPRK